ncbi:MAG: ABC transporter permease [Actinobacteria bacterium]|nr:MAG: ABC transporter permease [Actinomycetota bacterium]
MAVDAPITPGASSLDRELAGLGALWPKLAAIGVGLLVWQIVVWSQWRPDYVLPGPVPVFKELGNQLEQASFWHAIGITLQRAAIGYALAVLIGSLLGAAVARVRPLRRAIGSLITGLQTMPSIVWFPLAILLFKLGEGAILFVVVLGAAPSVANGLISGIDHIPPLMLRSGRVLGARGLGLFRFVILPAALPAFVGGLKQGWAFAWRSLMAGELLVIVANRPSIGARLEFARQFSQAEALLALMIVVLVIGILADSVFSAADRSIRRRWGLIEPTS